jgi:hypothetical protein
MRFSPKGTRAGDTFAFAVKQSEVATMGVRSLKLTRVSLMLFMAVACATAAFAQTSTTYGGEATALSGTVVGVPLNLAATGPVDPSGGARNNSLVCYPGGPLCYVGIPDLTSGLLSLQGLSATTVGRGDQAYSHASMSKVTMLISGVLVKADYAEAVVKSVCKDDGHGGRYSESTGRSEFSQLTIAGTPIAVTGQPNQTINVASPLGGTVKFVINEQTVNNGYLTVRALHATAPAILGLVNATNMTVGMGKTKIDCGDIDECFEAKITGGGFVVMGHGAAAAKITFAVSGQNLDDWGHLVAINHKTGDKFQATLQLTTIFSDGSAKITGVGQINGDGGLHPFVAHVKDGGEPGAGKDEFSLVVEDRKESFNIPPGKKIHGGNIQFHKSKGETCPVLPPPPPVDCPPGTALIEGVCQVVE